MTQPLPLLVAATLLRVEGETTVQLHGAEVVLSTDQLQGEVPCHKNLEVVADCVCLDGPDLTLPGRTVTIVCRELQLPRDGFTINVSGQRGTQDFTMGWQVEGGSVSLKANPGTLDGADGHQGEAGDDGGSSGHVVIHVHCITGGPLRIFANGGHGGKGQDGGDGAVGAVGLPGCNGGKGGNGGCAGTSGRGGDAGNINVRIVSMPPAVVQSSASSSSSSYCHELPTHSFIHESSPGPPSSAPRLPQSHCWPSSQFSQLVPLSKRCTMQVPELCNDPGIGGAAARGGLGGAGGPAGLQDVLLTAKRHLWTVIPYFTAHYTEQRPAGQPGPKGKKGRRGAEGLHGKSGHAAIAASSLAELLLALGLQHCQMMRHLAEELFLAEEISAAQSTLEWLCELTATSSDPSFTEIHRRCDTLLTFLQKGHDVFGRPFNFTPLLSLSSYIAHNHALLERLVHAEALHESISSQVTTAREQRQQLEATILMASTDICQLERGIQQNKMQKAQAESEAMRLTSLMERGMPMLQRAKTAFFNAVVKTVEGEEGDRLRSDLWDRFTELGRSSEKLWTKVPRKRPLQYSLREALRTLEVLAVESKVLCKVFSWTPPTSKTLQLKLNAQDIDQWVKEYSQLPEGAVYDRHARQYQEWRSSRDHHTALASQLHQTIISDSARLRQRKADVQETRSSLAHGLPTAATRVGPLMQHHLDALRQELLESLHSQNQALCYATLQRRPFRTCGNATILLEAEAASMELAAIKALTNIGREKQHFAGLPIIITREDSPAVFQSLEEDGVASFTIALAHPAFDGLCHIGVQRVAVWLPGAIERGAVSSGPFIQCRLVHTGASVAVRSCTNWRHEFCHPPRATLVSCYTAKRPVAGKRPNAADPKEEGRGLSLGDPLAPLAVPPHYTHEAQRAYASHPGLRAARQQCPESELGGGADYLELSPAATWRLEAVDALTGEPLSGDGVDFGGLDLIAIFFDGTFLPALSNEGGASIVHESIQTAALPSSRTRRHHRGSPSPKVAMEDVLNEHFLLRRAFFYILFGLFFATFLYFCGTFRAAPSVCEGTQ
eukprot:GGOE01036999.1.p1 GENE.GGOE01036999.1~~GGOE01036999.1.p1  ORF type:complete len:1074 (+),score=177.60 GGOE01036999.1:33-3224(+)